MNRSLLFATIVACAAPLWGACGAHNAKYTVDDVSLAQIPIEEKKAIFDAQNDVSVAKSEKAKADADADSTKQEIAVAEAERDQAKLEVEKAKLEADMADKAKDVRNDVANAVVQGAREVERRAMAMKR